MNKSPAPNKVLEAMAFKKPIIISRGTGAVEDVHNREMSLVIDYDAWTAYKQCRIIYPNEIEEIVKSGVNTFHINKFLFIEKGKKTELFNA